MKKKLLALILTGLMLVSLVGCARESNETEPTPTPESTPEATATLDPAEASESPDAQEEVSDSPVVKETVSEQVLFDEGGILITAKGLENDGDFDAELNLLIENNSDADITVQDRNASVNGYMMGTIFSCTVAAGKKANSRISFSSRDMRACGIRTIADIELSFHIFGDEIETIDSDKILVKTSAFDAYEYNFDDSGTEIYNENGIRIISKGFVQPGSKSDVGLSLFIENTTEKDITVQERGASANGFMVSTIFSEHVTAGKHALTTIKILSSSLEENEIKKIENMEFSFHIFDPNDRHAPSIDSNPITVTEENSGGALLSMDELCSLINNLIADTYSGCTVTYDDNMITVNIWYDGIAEMVASGSQSVKDSWPDLTDSLVTTSEGISGFIEVSGNDGVSLTFNLLNDLNHENILVSIVDGVVIYNVMDE